MKTAVSFYGAICLAFFAGLFLPTSAQILAQEPLSELRIYVSGVSASQGTIRVALYQEASSFLDFEGVAAAAVAPAVEGQTLVVFKDLPTGKYAAALYHDANNNEKMDSNWLGIPKEALGFSMARLRTFGPPKFEDCVFAVTGIQRIDIPLENN